MASIACLLVRKPVALKWLGDARVFEWCVKQLGEIRGVDEVWCLTLHEHHATVCRSTVLTKLIPGARIGHLPSGLAVDDNAGIAQYVAQMTTGEPNEVILLLDALAPFLTAAKLEACMDHTASGQAAITMPARMARVMITDSKTQTSSLQQVPEPVSGVFALTRQAALKKSGGVRTIEVTRMEALRVDDEDDFNIAKGLVDTCVK